MKKGFVPGVTFAAALALTASPVAAQEFRDARPDAATAEAAAPTLQAEEASPQAGADVVAFEESPSHIFLTREEHERAISRQALARRSANMTYHGGKIMTQIVAKAIFWGPSWSTSPGDKITGLDSWYGGFGNSNYAKTNIEYTGTNGTVGTAMNYQGHIVDTSTAAGGNNANTILAEVCKQVTAGNISPDPGGNGYYPVYSDKKRGSAGYCAWHSVGSCSGKVVQFAFFFNLDGDAGCDPADTQTGHSPGLAALANVSAHELSEAMTDPANPGAWYDSSGAENGDKCAWTFNVPFVTFPNGTQWKQQGEWSNKAYTAGTGYPNLSNQKGCLDGH